MYDNGDLDRIVISPGPGHPTTDSGISREVIGWGMGKVPILGVCMGLECLVDAMGGEVCDSAPLLALSPLSTLQLPRSMSYLHLYRLIKPVLTLDCVCW
jgi:GMP synthase-like glutamine amidotransferase